MKADNCFMLNEVLQEMRQEILEIESEIQYNARCIKEAEVYMKTLADSEPDDFKVFSPRNSVKKDKIEVEKTNLAKLSYEQKCAELKKKREILSHRIDTIEKILQRENNSYTLLNIQEEDRQRIARDLHDTSLQNLAHLVHKIELSSMYIDKDPIQAKLELSVINKRLRDTIDEIRNIIFDLRPMTFDDLGLKYALERLLLNLNEENIYDISSDIDNVSCENNVVLVTIYRLVQETLNNIRKHSGADKIIFSCKNVGNQCILDIEDNGRGFDLTSFGWEDADNSNNTKAVRTNEKGKHFGIFLMKERVDLINGQISISSRLGEGTKIHIEIPLIYMNSRGE